MPETQETQSSSHPNDAAAKISTKTRKKLKNETPENLFVQPPEQKLLECEERAKFYSDSHHYKQALEELIRCVALTRICYGDCHWKQAEAHVNLAQGYLQLKGLSLQAKQHAERAKKILFTDLVMPSPEENVDILKCLVNLFHVLGRALISLQKLKDAEQNLTKAEGLSAELLHCKSVLQEEGMEIQARIKLSFAQLYQIQKKFGDALTYYQEALKYTESSRGVKCRECIPIFREMAGAEQAQGHHDSAIDHLLEAHFIARTQSPSAEAADSAHSIAQAAVASPRPEHNDVAEQYFQESLMILKKAGEENAKFLTVQDDFCQFLLTTGQHERAALILKGSLDAKVATFGDVSPEVAETYWILGGTDLTLGHQHEAYKELKKCLQLQTLLYGSRDKRTTATKETVDLLAKVPEIAAKQSSKERLANKAKPPFCAIIPQHTLLGGAKVNV
ncbi:tetratricopeptide repeat protein 23 isoform X1 [Ornithorhynchus anatinus]|uniref:Tetratricopeptide repeat domain 23 n=1 Tax=Ornithorhynchus anatinus TaxID=9258 RepID=F7B226_ORNAN|nr:tetratricopeptide repeat protein 23 isoform X1 [Ornithorhynchus anatinus]